MAWRIQTTGTRDGVLKAVAEAKTEPPEEDQRQFDAAKTVIALEVSALPSEFNGATVTASGSVDGGGRTAQFEVRGLKLAV